MLGRATVAAVAASLLSLVDAQSSTFTPLRPPSLPLAVKSPYLQTWQQAGSDGGNGGYLAGKWPTFWQGQILGWAGLIQVDGATYTWMGEPMVNGAIPPVVNQTAFSYSSTRSVFSMDVGGLVNMTITFLSNITPNDLQRQSVPFSYLDVQVTSMDGAPHDVQVYTDISGEFVSGDRSSIIQWDYNTTTTGGGSKVKARGAGAPAPSGLAHHGHHSAPQSGHKLRGGASSYDHSKKYTYFGTQTSYSGWTTAVLHDSTTYIPPTTTFEAPVATATPSTVNRAAATNTPVDPPTNGTDTGGVAYHRIYRQSQLLFSEIGQQAEWGYWWYVTRDSANLTHQSGADVDVRAQFVNNGFLMNSEDTDFRAINDAFPVFAFAYDFGSVTDAVNYTWGIGHTQEQAVQFLGYGPVATINSLWTSYFADDLAAITFSYDDYATQSSLATSFDNMVATDSTAAAGTNYTALTAIAARQAFGALSWTNTTENPLVFIKEISSNGNVQTVDVIFPWHPIALYTNPNILRWTLDPLFINQEAGNWPYQFPIHDVGSRYPNATGHPDGNAEQQPLEEAGNMIIMTLAYAQRANDVSYLNQHYDILRQWNDFLVSDALYPNNQISTDDFAGALVNQTNLAVKGIIGIQAMAAIANLTGNTADGANFSTIAGSYIEQWQTIATAADATPPHTTLNYGDNSSYSLLYNIYADKELSLNLIPQSVYDMQSAFYPGQFNEYGVPLDTRHTYTKSDWETFVAAVATVDTRDEFINTLVEWAGATSASGPFPDLFDTITGDTIANATFNDRPVVGGKFALLALNSAPAVGSKV